MPADQDKSKEELLREVEALRRQLNEMQSSGIARTSDRDLRRSQPIPKPLERELRLRTETFATVTLALTSHISLDEVLDEILEQTHRLVPYKTANIALLEGDMLVVKRWRGYVNQGFIQNLRHALSDTPLEMEAFQKRRGIVISDTHQHPKWQIWKHLEWVRSYIGIPILLQDQILGILRLDSDIPNQFSEHDIELLQPLASAAAIALENAQLYQHAQEEISERTRVQTELEAVNFELEQRVALRTKEYQTAKRRVEVILDNSSDGIFFAYSDRGIQQTNRAFNTLLHCTQDDYFNRSVMTLVTPESHALLQSVLDAVMEDEATRHLEIGMMRKDGSVFDAEIGIAHMKMGEGEEGVVCNLRDISLRKQIESALRSSEAQMRAILDGTYTYIGLLKPDGTLIIANKAALGGVGLTDLEQVDGKFYWDTPWWDWNETGRQQIIDGIRRAGKGEFVRFEAEHWTVNGVITVDFSLSPIKDENGQVILLVPEGRDITEKKRAEDSLRQTKNQLQSILDNSAAVIYANDTRNRLMMVNHQYEKVFNVKSDEVVGSGLGQTLAEETMAQLLANNRQVFETGKTLEFEEQITLEDGVHTYLSIKSPLLDESGTPYAICGISTDITERKKAEIELRQALETQKELNELKTRFVSMVSHEFRTPLATIQAASDALKAYMPKMTPEQITNRLDKIQMQIKYMTQLMSDVLTLEQIQVGRLQYQPDHMDLVAFCHDVVDELNEDRLPRVMFKATQPQYEFVADERLLRQVLLNLLTNALKYSAETSPVEFDLCIDVNRVILTCRDYGIGIPEKDQVHLFEPFYRASNVGAISGSGLGLVIAKQAVELHNGTLECVSRDGMGTTFTVTFPLNTETNQA
ncbi:MAG: PAS domain S-box protein [Anaerolineae bacterium]